MTRYPKPSDAGEWRRLKIRKMYGRAARIAWRDAKTRGMRDPVVFIFDCHDEIGGPVARGLVGHKEVEGAIARSEEAEIDDAILLTCKPFDAVQKMMRRGFHHFDDIAAERPAEGVILWVVFAGHGVTSGRWHETGRHVPKPGMN